MPEKMGRATIEMFLEIKKTGVGNKLNNQKIMESKIIIRDSSQ
jgi:hypothetical protein